ncbi:MAG: hypothetical protein ACRYFB_08460 [Janthinobacterium lividum]
MIDLGDRKVIGWALSSGMKGNGNSDSGLQNGTEKQTYYPKTAFSF